MTNSNIDLTNPDVLDKAVREFQTAHGLNADGVVGPLTTAAFLKAIGSTGEAPTTTTTQPAPGPTHGIDIYQDNIDSWSDIYNAGYRYVWIKSSDGSHTRPQFVQHFTEAKAAGFLPGAYHWYQPSVDVESQVSVMIDQLKAAGWKAGEDLPPALDFETFSGGEDAGSEDFAKANAFLKSAQAQLGVKVILYASDSQIGNAPSWIDQDIVWDARYGSKPSYDKWAFFQNSGLSRVPGLNGGDAASDTDIFQGSMADLRALVQASKL